MPLSVVSTLQPKLDPNIVIANGDSAASDHYFCLYDAKCLTNIKKMKSVWEAKQNNVVISRD